MNVIVHKLDNYSRTILTIIALCLVIICFNLVFKPEIAEANKSSVIDVNIKEIGGSYIGNKVPVNIEAINGNSTGSTLKVDIESINSIRIYGPEMPVKIK